MSWRSRTHVWLVAGALALVAVVGCSNRSAPPTVVPTDGTSTPTPTSTPGSGDAPSLGRVKLTFERRWTGFEQPLFATHAGDGSGRIFVVEKAGRVRVVRDGKLMPSAFLDFSDKVSGGGEQGLLGLAFSPTYGQSGRLYVNYTDTAGDTNIVRITVADPAADRARVNGTQLVLKVEQPYANHNGGGIVFGPDEYLYIGMGDGGSGGDPEGRAQNPRVLLGKMLRIDVGDVASMSSDPPKTYRIPRDNPYAAGAKDAGRADPAIWAIGLRNPWRFSFDRLTHDLWIGDVGQNAWEEIDVAPPGAGGLNFGWNLFEGTHAYPSGATRPSGVSGFVMPIIEYPHPTGESVTGGYVYRGSASPVLTGTYIYGDYSTGRVWGYRPGSSGKTAENVELADTEFGISSFGEDEAGEIYLCDLNGGAVYRLSARER